MFLKLKIMFLKLQLKLQHHPLRSILLNLMILINFYGDVCDGYVFFTFKDWCFELPILKLKIKWPLIMSTFYFVFNLIIYINILLYIYV